MLQKATDPTEISIDQASEAVERANYASEVRPGKLGEIGMYTRIIFKRVTLVNSVQRIISWIPTTTPWQATSTPKIKILSNRRQVFLRTAST